MIIQVPIALNEQNPFYKEVKGYGLTDDEIRDLVNFTLNYFRFNTTSYYKFVSDTKRLGLALTAKGINTKHMIVVPLFFFYLRVQCEEGTLTDISGHSVHFKMGDEMLEIYLINKEEEAQRLMDVLTKSENPSYSIIKFVYESLFFKSISDAHIKSLGLEYYINLFKVILNKRLNNKEK